MNNFFGSRNLTTHCVITMISVGVGTTMNVMKKLTKRGQTHRHANELD